MKALEEAKKQYWYDNNFDKSDKHWGHQIDLNNFGEGWKAALGWALTQETDLQSTEIAHHIREELKNRTS